MCEVKPMLALIALDLEAHPPPAAVTRVTLSARPVRARAGQSGLWQPPTPRLRDLVAVLARLAALVGPDNVGSPRLDDSHRPDAYTMLAFAPPDSTDGAERAGGAGRAPRQDPPISDEHRLVLRRTRPPRRVAVETDDERPSRVDGQRVVGCAGPWRASGAWWDEEVWARDEWDVALGDGTLFRLARDLTTGAWSVDGVYD
jgi:protein ImuB